MKYSTPIMTALAAMYPASGTEGWTSYPSLFFPETTMEDLPSKMIQRQQTLMDRVMGGSGRMRSSSPKYEITNDDEKFQLAMAVPGVTLEDLKVDLDENRMLTISGHQQKEKKTETESYSFTSKFSQSFSLNDPTIDLDKFSATLENGVLLVTAPKDIKLIEQNVRSIAIKENPTKSTRHEVKIESKDRNGGDVDEEAVDHKKEMSTTIDPELEITKETYDIN